MRRRQAYALQTQLAKERSALLYSKPPVIVPEVMGGKKSGCQYCGKDIRRGLFMHEKYCKAK